VENTPSSAGLASDELDEWDEAMLLEDGELPDPHPSSEGRILAPDSPVDDEELGIRLEVPISTLSLDFLVQSLFDNRYSVDLDLADTWLDDTDFLLKRWGLTLSETTENGPDYHSTKLGARKHQADIAVINLLDAICNKEPAELTSDCDLCESYLPPEDDGFPSRSPNNILHIVPFQQRYLVTINDGVPRPWKLLIKDPLTLLQMERERWHLQGDSLISNLVRKGVPFKILYPTCQDGATFYPHQGPIIHPPNKAPTHIDYMSYNLDVAHFFRHHPHAHVAALCTGGIVWRIAVEALPIPAEHNFIRPFHRNCCDHYIDGDQQYWSPSLAPEDVEVIVGVYKWSGKSSQRYSESMLFMNIRKESEHQA
jgi:hypothetical protein